MTPMIDVVFLLIVFFVAVSQIVDRDAVQLDLPLISDSAASDLGVDRKVIVNIASDKEGRASHIHVGGFDVSMGDHEALQRIVQTRVTGGASEIHIRAERTVSYKYIYDVLETIRALDGTKHVQLVIRDDKG